MSRVAVALYDHRDNATEVLDQLQHAGFDATQLECIEPDPTTNQFRRRGVGEGTSGSSVPKSKALRLLEHLGIPEDDAHHYLEEIALGRSLVAARSEEELSGRARQIMNQYPLAESKEVGTLEDEQAPRGPRPGVLTTGQIPAGRHRRRSRRKYPSTEIISVSKPESESRSPRPPQKPRPRRDNPALGELSGRAAEERYKLYRPEFVRHYEQHYAALGEFSYDDFARAYRYGMALATDPAHRDEDWTNVEPIARRQWQQRMHRPFKLFREAIRFGWYVIRGEEEKYRGRPGH